MTRLLLTLLLAGCTAPLLEDLSERHANELTAALLEEGVDAEKAGSRGRFRVEVEKAKLPEAWAVARALGFPRTTPPQEAERLILSPAEAVEANRRARAAQVVHLLEAWPGVEEARVVLHEGGGAVTLSAQADAKVEVAEVERLTRASAGLTPSASLEVKVFERPPRSRPALAPQADGATVPLIIGGLLCAAAATGWGLVLKMRAKR